MSFADFLREVRAELHKVAWPDRSETRRAAIVVLVVLVAVVVAIGLIDAITGRAILALFD